MLQRVILPTLLLLLGYVSSQTTSNSSAPTCRCFPGDSCWPSNSDWDSFNKTLGGKLISTVPLSSVCHNDKFASYNASACAELQSVYFYSDPHIQSPSSIMSPFFTNNSCDPFAPQNASCTIGNFAWYSVNASGPEDYQKTIAFTTKNNIRLVIKNTGHDYNGKGTGAGAVGVWTRNMKSLEVITNYNSPNYSGTAIKMGAGIEVIELFRFAHNNGLVAVGGTCPTVGVAGGYSQGAGHGPLASKFGLGADNVLEWEVVTGTGELLVASATNNSDLYWALSGGGGGTYGIVSALTVKAHPDMPTSGINFTFAQAGNVDGFWDVVSTFQSSLPKLVDTGSMALFSLSGGNFSLMPALGPNVSLSELESLLAPTMTLLNKTGIPYTYYSNSYNNFLDAYLAFFAPWNVSQAQIGGRLIPRSLVEQNNPALITAMRNITDTGTEMTGVCINVSRGVPDPSSNAVNPYWRRSLYNAVLGTTYDYNNMSVNVERQDATTNVLLPQLEALTPDGGAYINEADWQQPDWQNVFYGSHYSTLLSIKRKYDPNDIFYALTGVGSEAWWEDQEAGGRLCRS